MKPILKNISGGRGWRLFWSAGWLVAALLAVYAVPRIYHRLILRLPSAQQTDWTQVMALKKQELSSPWRDTRPLVILAGDSEIERGDWYDLFSGAWAVRNCGLSSARIIDVTELVSAIGDSRPKCVILMCGVNSLSRHETPADCLRDYEDLLAAVHSHLQPESTLVLSVMPVRESLLDRAAHEFNTVIKGFNDTLAASCQRQQVAFLNVNSAVTDSNGGLAGELTIDGLHLNRDGYRRLAEVVAAHLTPPAAP